MVSQHTGLFAGIGDAASGGAMESREMDEGTNLKKCDMKKTDFRKILIPDIEGHVQEADFSKQLGNQLYMQGQNIEECELGKRIYFDGEVELSEADASAVKKIIAGYSFVARQALIVAIDGKEV